MKVTGNIGRAIEEKTTKGGRTYKHFSVAESYGKEDNRTTHWFGIDFYGKKEDLDGMKAGTRVEVEGDLKVNVKEGKVYMDLMTSRVKLAPLPPKKDAPAAAAPAAAATPAVAAAPTAAAAGGVPDRFSDMDDDIPF